MDRIRSFMHRGKLINYFDYRGLIEEAAFIETLHSVSAFLKRQNKPTRQLVNVTDVYITKGLIQPILSEIEQFKPYVLKEAILGITGGKRVLLQTYAAFFPGKVKAFSDEDEALKWLTRDGGI